MPLLQWFHRLNPFTLTTGSYLTSEGRTGARRTRRSLMRRDTCKVCGMYGMLVAAIVGPGDDKPETRRLCESCHLDLLYRCHLPEQTHTAIADHYPSQPVRAAVFRVTGTTTLDPKTLADQVVRNLRRDLR